MEEPCWKVLYRRGELQHCKNALCIMVHWQCQARRTPLSFLQDAKILSYLDLFFGGFSLVLWFLSFTINLKNFLFCYICTPLTFIDYIYICMNECVVFIYTVGISRRKPVSSTPSANVPLIKLFSIITHDAFRLLLRILLWPSLGLYY